MAAVSVEATIHQNSAPLAGLADHHNKLGLPPEFLIRRRAPRLNASVQDPSG